MVGKVLVAVALAMFSLSAAAIPIQYTYTGTIQGAPGTFTAGATVSGTVFYDSEAAFSETQTDPSFARYATGGVTYSILNPVTQNGLAVNQTVQGSLTGAPLTQIDNDLADNQNGLVADTFTVRGSGGNSGASQVANFSPNALSFVINDTETMASGIVPDAFTTTAISDSTLTSLMLSDFDQSFLEFTFASGGGSPIRFNIDSLTAVPLPAGVWLFLTAIGLLYRGARRQAAA